MTKTQKRINNLIGLIIGIVASAVYIMTAEPTVSWWDCGEYIATTSKLLSTGTDCKMVKLIVIDEMINSMTK